MTFRAIALAGVVLAVLAIAQPAPAQATSGVYINPYGAGYYYGPRYYYDPRPYDYNPYYYYEPNYYPQPYYYVPRYRYKGRWRRGPYSYW